MTRIRPMPRPLIGGWEPRLRVFLLTRSHRDSGTQAAPQGFLPTAIVAATFHAPASITLTSFEGPFAVYRRVPSGLMAIPHGREPTESLPRTEPSALFSASTSPARP